VARARRTITPIRKNVLFREVNERVVEVSRQAVEGEIEILCECGEDACLAQITLTAGQYDAVRGIRSRFVVAPGHEDTQVERIVETRAAYVVVEKLRRSAESADLLPHRKAG
jgi:hypothetical protein